MNMILSFLLLGFAAGCLFYFNSLIISKFKIKAISITLDIIYCVTVFLVFFCFLVGYNYAQMRYYYLLFFGLGFFLYNLIFHKMFKKYSKKLLH